MNSIRNVAVEAGGGSGGVLSSAAGVAGVALLVSAVVGSGLVAYQQRDTLFGNRGYSTFEKKYAAQLKASRQRVAEALAQSPSGVRGDHVDDVSTSGTAGEAAAEEQETSMTARVKVIYGSDSGNAEAFAKGLVMTLVDLGVSAALVDPSRWPYLERYTRQAPRAHTLFQFPPPAAAQKAAHPATHVNTSRKARFSAASGTRSNTQRGRESVHNGDKEDTQPTRHILLFVVATAGEGEPPANFHTLFQEIKQAVQDRPQVASVGTATDSEQPTHGACSSDGKGGVSAIHPTDSTTIVTSPDGTSTAALPRPAVFAHVQYAVFALGDSSYKYYCRAGMTVNTLLKTGGGEEVHRIGFGDARGGASKQEECFEDWQDGVLRALAERCGVTLSAGSLEPPKPQMRFVAFPPLPRVSSEKDGHERDATGPAERVGGDEEKHVEEAKYLPQVWGSGQEGDIAAASTGAAAWLNGLGGPAPYPPPAPLLEPSLHRPTLLQLIRREQLTPVREDDGSAVYRFAFSLQGTNISYQAGDHLGVYARNPPAVVERCARVLGLSERDLCEEVELQEARTRTVMGNALPARVTLRTALSCYTDLCGKPKKSALRVVAKYCTDAGEKRAFLRAVDIQRGDAARADAAAPSSSGVPNAEASQADGGPTDETDAHDAADADSGAPLRTILDFMEKYPSCCDGVVPVGHFLEIVPRIQPRYYSIATDRTTHPCQLQIYARVVPNGLASGFLASRVVAAEQEEEGGPAAADACVAAASADLVDADTPVRAGHERSVRQERQQSHDDRWWRDPSLVFAFVRPSTFHLPLSLPATAPVLMIGPGTGVAAMIGLLYRREALMRRHPTTAFGDCLLFLGARHAATEFFVKDEVLRWSMTPAEMAARDAAHPQDPVAVAARQSKDADRRLLSSVITLLECAFSRDGEKKVYVTDLIAKHADFIFDMMVNCKESMIFLSGDATSMAKDVDRALVSLIQARTKKGRLSALAVLQKMESEHRYLKDVY